MSCILRIGGETLDVDALLSCCTLTVDNSWRKGTLRGMGSKVHSTSGATFVASEADFEQFKTQVDDVSEFLRAHMAEISRLASFGGVDHATLDFAVSLYKDSITKFCYLPPELVRSAASAGLGLEVSYYASSDEPEDEG
jgi:hypothetical protein